VLPNNLVLAPMAGVTDGPFRRLCAHLGAGLTVSELASSKGLMFQTRQTFDMIRFDGQPRPYAAQIFGADPQTMAQAAALVESLNVCDFIDLNMGCPVAKVVKTGAGSALMKNPELAGSILRAVKGAVRLPVTVKCRVGWSLKTVNVRDFARRMVDEGAAALTVHARTKEDGYIGTARWELLEGLQEVCGRVPLIANGDIHTAADLKKLHEISGCQGFMLGRGVVGRPWVFGDLLKTAPVKTPLPSDFSWRSAETGEQRFACFREHLRETLMDHGGRGVLLFRVHLFNYIRGHNNAAQLRRELCFERNPVTVLDVGRRFFLGGEGGA
jgi:tRNA-dihydrouridine synthase B